MSNSLFETNIDQLKKGLDKQLLVYSNSNNRILLNIIEFREKLDAENEIEKFKQKQDSVFKK